MTDESDDKHDLENTPQPPVSPSKMKSLHQILETWTEKGFRHLFFWETDDKKLGTLIRFLHRSIIYTLFIWYIVIHTFLPSYFLLVLFYGIMGLIWVHHIICGGCLTNKIEQKLIGDSSSFIDPILTIFQIPITRESTIGVTIASSTSIMLFLSFELASRTILNIRQWIPF